MTMPNWKRLKNNALDISIFESRAKILKAIRQFFDAQGFLEIEPPLLTPWPTFDNNITSMDVQIRQGDQIHPFYLHTSPEHAMKKCLAGNMDKIYYLGKVFRSNEYTAMHNPEYTLLEWYRTHADYHDIIYDTSELIKYVAETVFETDAIRYQGKSTPLMSGWEQVTLENLFETVLEIPLKYCLDFHALKLAAKKWVQIDENDDWESLFFKLFLNKIEPRLGVQQPTFVLNYPIQMGLMAKRIIGQQDWVERVELYIQGMELANGYTELTGPYEQKQRFLEDLKKKPEYTTAEIDQELIEAMELGLPPCAGMALGVDRLLMLFLDKTDIQDVILFPMEQMIKK